MARVVVAVALASIMLSTDAGGDPVSDPIPATLLRRIDVPSELLACTAEVDGERHESNYCHQRFMIANFRGGRVVRDVRLLPHGQAVQHALDRLKGAAWQ